MKQNCIKINLKQNNLRIDKFLSAQYPNIKVSDLQKFFKKKEITVNNKKIDYNYLLKTNDEINFSTFIENILINPTNKKQEKTKNDLIEEKYINIFKNSIIFENDDLIAINKPYDLAVQGGTNVAISIASILLAINKIENKALKLVHRIDKTTSGLLLIAKNFETANVLGEMFKNKTAIEKTYLAIVDGKVAKSEGIIDFPLLKKIENNVEKVYRDDKNGKQALTKYKVVKYLEKYKATLLEVQIFTGRTHQIRVHLKEIGYPVLGDFKYNPNKNNTISSTHLQLHAYKIKLTLFNNKVNLIAEIPDYMQKLLV